MCGCPVLLERTLDEGILLLFDSYLILGLLWLCMDMPAVYCNVGGMKMPAAAPPTGRVAVWSMTLV